MTDKKCFDYRHIICVAITVGFLACGLMFPSAPFRFIESCRDFGLSIAYYFCELFGVEYSFNPTVNELPSLPALPFLPIANDFEGFKADWARYWQLWVTKENFFGYLSALLNGLEIFFKNSAYRNSVCLSVNHTSAAIF